MKTCKTKRVHVSVMPAKLSWISVFLSFSLFSVKQRIRGWFPRKCAKEMMDDNDNVHEKKDA